MDSMSLRISHHHPAFPGHFPGAPIVPGAVLLDEALRALEPADGAQRIKCNIAAAKFHSAVRPGESLTPEYERFADGSIRFIIRTPDRTVASGRLTRADAIRSADREA